MNREPLPAIPHWDPNYDVAAGLPPEIRLQHADRGEGIGNYEDEAIADYFAKAEAYCGADWRRYTRPPRIVDGYDPQHREYCVAIPDYEQPLLQGLSDPDDVVGEGPAPSRSVEIESAAVLTTAGGDKLRPYAPFEGSPETRREPWPVNREPQFGGHKDRPYGSFNTSPNTPLEPRPQALDPRPSTRGP